MGVSEKKQEKKIGPQNNQKSDQTEKLANLIVTKNGEEWFWLARDYRKENIFGKLNKYIYIIIYSYNFHLNTRSLHIVQEVSFIPPEKCFSNFTSEKLLPVALALQCRVSGSDSSQLILTSEIILSRNIYEI